MALRAVPDHPKFAELKAILGQPKGPVAGWLEMMWHFTGRFTPKGTLGSTRIRRSNRGLNGKVRRGSLSRPLFSRDGSTEIPFIDFSFTIGLNMRTRRRRMH